MRRPSLLFRVPGYRQPRPDLLTGGQPDEDDWGRLKRAGVSRVVSLRTPDELGGRDPAREACDAGLDYVSLPVDGAAGVTHAAASALWDLLEAYERVTLVHCATGNRVGALLAVAAAGSNAMSPHEALAFGRAAGLAGLEPRVRELVSAFVAL